MRSNTARRKTAACNDRGADDRGATAVEYALIIAGIAIAIITSVALVGGQVTSGVAAAAEGLSGSPTGSSTTAAAVSTPSATPTATATPTPTVRSCSGSAVDRDGPRDNTYVSPTSCNTTTGSWVCPSGYRLDPVGSNWTCKD